VRERDEAYVAEQWGRRWITCDTSRVALALARTRLMAARFPYYLLANSTEGQRRAGELSAGLPQPLPDSGRPSTGPGDESPGTGDSLPGTGDSIPDAGEPLPGAGEPFAGTGEPLPRAGESFPHGMESSARSVRTVG